MGQVVTIVRGAAIGAVVLIGNMLVPDGITTGEDRMSEEMYQAAIIFAEAGMRSTNLRSKIAAEAIISSMKSFAATMEDAISRNALGSAISFNATISTNVLWKSVDGDVDKILKLLQTKQNSDWKQVALKVQMQLDNQEYWAKAAIATTALLFVFALLSDVFTPDLHWIERQQKEIPEQNKSVRVYVTYAFNKITAWFRANALKLVGLCAVIFLAYASFCAHWNMKLTIVRMDAQRGIMLKQMDAMRKQFNATSQDLQDFKTDQLAMNKKIPGISERMETLHNPMVGRVDEMHKQFNATSQDLQKLFNATSQDLQDFKTDQLAMNKKISERMETLHNPMVKRVDEMQKKIDTSSQELVAMKTRFLPIGTIVPFNGDPVPLRKLGWAVCDGTSPGHQGIPDAVLSGHTPLINDNRFIKGVHPDKRGARNDDAATLSFLSIPAEGTPETGGYVHGPVSVPTDGNLAAGGLGIFAGSWDRVDKRVNALTVKWDREEVQPKSIGMTYIILVK